jgi:hypothetical protein
VPALVAARRVTLMVYVAIDSRWMVDGRPRGRGAIAHLSPANWRAIADRAATLGRLNGEKEAGD